uniref:Uncharacterized protein n=1 Tax=Lates calcarifer TaxID=8187 RepID=A0A4W6CB72_LATCA
MANSHNNYVISSFLSTFPSPDGKTKSEGDSYPPLSVGVSPNSVHSPTDMSRELRTVTTAARARPHLDFTMSILPAGSKGYVCAFVNWTNVSTGKLLRCLAGCILAAVYNVPVWGLSLHQTGTALAHKHTCTYSTKVQ